MRIQVRSEYCLPADNMQVTDAAADSLKSVVPSKIKRLKCTQMFCPTQPVGQGVQI